MIPPGAEEKCGCWPLPARQPARSSSQRASTSRGPCEVLSILAIIFGAIARKQAIQRGQAGAGIALAGLILGIIGAPQLGEICACLTLGWLACRWEPAALVINVSVADGHLVSRLRLRSRQRLAWTLRAWLATRQRGSVGMHSARQQFPAGLCQARVNASHS
ncbi:MAG: DUF4190 domain-containing protein [Actinobacteria bacterium]|nr:DUF4190 domain-containing protein [Actinomycetota bacterium]